MTSSIPPVLCGRRAALLAAGVVGIGGLAACSSGGTSGQGEPTDGGNVGGSNLATKADIPVGGGKIFASAGVIITQPTAGTFKAFSDICTHQGATIDRVSSGIMQCPLHGSEFSITDGSVVQGPATQPLPEKSVTVTGNNISVA